MSRARLLSEVRSLVDEQAVRASCCKEQRSRSTATTCRPTRSSPRSGSPSSSSRRRSTSCSTSRHLKVTAARPAPAPRRTPPGSSRLSRSFPAFSEKFRDHADRSPGAVAKRSLASYADTSDADGRGVLPGAPGAVRLRVRQERRAHPREDAGRGAGDPRSARGAAVRSRRSRRQKSTDTGSAQQGGDARLPHGRRVRAGVPDGGRDRAVRHAGRPGEDAVRLPRDPRDQGARADVRERARRRCTQALKQQGQHDLSTAVNELFKRFKVHVDPRFGTWRLDDERAGSAGLPGDAAEGARRRATSREGTTTTTAPAARTEVP